MKADTATTEDKIWKRYQTTNWYDIPEDSCLVMLGMIRRSYPENYPLAVRAACKRKKLSSPLLALAVELKLAGEWPG